MLFKKDNMLLLYKMGDPTSVADYPESPESPPSPMRREVPQVDDNDWPEYRGGKTSRMKSRRLASRSRSRKFKTSRHKKTRRHTRRNRRKNRNK